MELFPSIQLTQIQGPWNLKKAPPRKKTSTRWAGIPVITRVLTTPMSRVVITPLNPFIFGHLSLVSWAHLASLPQFWGVQLESFGCLSVMDTPHPRRPEGMDPIGIFPWLQLPAKKKQHMFWSFIFRVGIFTKTRATIHTCKINMGQTKMPAWKRKILFQ